MTTQNFSHTNKTNQYQVVADHSDVILTGTKADCYRKLNSINVESSKWGIVETLAPGETTTGDMVMPEPMEKRKSGPVDFSSLIHPDYR